MQAAVACKFIAAVILFYFSADICVCAMDAAVYFNAAYILFYCT